MTATLVQCQIYGITEYDCYRCVWGFIFELWWSVRESEATERGGEAFGKANGKQVGFVGKESVS